MMRTLRGLAALWLYFALILATLLPAGTSHAAAIRVSAEPVRDRYVVMLSRDTADVEAVARALTEKYDGKLVTTWRHAVKGFLVEMQPQQAARLAGDKRVVSIEQDAVMTVSGSEGLYKTGPASGVSAYEDFNHAAPPDPLWHLSYISHRQGRPVNPPSDFFRYAYGNDGSWGTGDDDRVRVYIIDQGIWTNHEEFQAQPPLPAARLTEGFNASSVPDYVRPPGPQVTARPLQTDPFTSLSPCNATTNPPLLASTHGTATASMIVGRKVGVAKGVELYAIKAATCADTEYKGQTTSTAVMLSAIDHVIATQRAYALAHGGQRRAAVLSMSMFRTAAWTSSTPVSRPQPNVTKPDLDVLEAAFKAVVESGVPVFASANNKNDDACGTVPARFSRRSGRGVGVITVGGIHALREERWVNDHDAPSIAGNLNKPLASAEAGSNYGQCVDIFAPATHLRVASRTAATEDVYSPGHAGTSYSAPIVAGLAARILAASPTLRNHLLTADDKVAEELWKLLAANASPFIPSTTVIHQLVPKTGGGTEFQISHGPAKTDAASPFLRAYLGSATFKTQLPPVAHTAGTASLTVEMVEPDVAYQWYRGEAGDPASFKITGATAATFATGDAGKYWVRVRRTDLSCPAGETCTADAPIYYADSITAEVIIDGCTLPPRLTKQPQSKILDVTQSAIQVFASELEAFSGIVRYQWFEIDPTERAIGPVGQLSSSGGGPVAIPSMEVLTNCTAGAEGCVGTTPITYQLRLCRGDGCSPAAACVSKSDTAQVRACPPPSMILPMDGGVPANIALVQNLLFYTTHLQGTTLEWLYSETANGEYKPLRFDLSSEAALTRNQGVKWVTFGEVNGVSTAPAARVGFYKVRVGSHCTTAESPVFELTNAFDYFAPEGRVGEGHFFPIGELATITHPIPQGFSTRLELRGIPSNGMPDPKFTDFEWRSGATTFTARTNPFVTQLIAADQVFEGRAFDSYSREWTPWLRFNLDVTTETGSCNRAIRVAGVTGAGGRCGSADEPMIVTGSKYLITELSALLFEPTVPDPPGGDAEIPRTNDPANPTNFYQDNFYYEWAVNGTVVRSGKGLQYLVYFHEILTDMTVTLSVKAGPTCPSHTFEFKVRVVSVLPEYELQHCSLVDLPPSQHLERSNCPNQSLCPRRHAVEHEGVGTLVLPFTYGQVAVFSAPAETLPSTYTWYRQVGTTVTEIGTESSISVVLTIPAEYYVTSRNAQGESTSYKLVAVLVDTASEVTITPPARTITAGQSAAFSATVAGVDPATLSYEWRSGSSYRLNTPVGTSANVTLFGLYDNSTFWCRVIQNRGLSNEHVWDSALIPVVVNCTNSVGAVATAFPQNVARDQQPMLIPGGHGKLLTYTWTRSSQNDPAVVFSTLKNPKPVVTAAATTFGGTVEDSCGQTGLISPVTVYLCVPSILQQPVGFIARATDPKTLTIVARPAIDGQVLTIRWYRTSDTLMASPLGTGPTFEAPVAPGTSDSFFATVTSTCGTQPHVVRSESATVQVCATPVMTSLVTVYRTTPTMPVTLIVNGSADDTYMWYRGVSGDTSLPLGRTERTYFTMVSQTTQFWCQATSLGLCTKNSDTITVEVCSAPGIVTQPQNASTFPGGSVTLSALGQSSTHPITYQWQSENASGNWVDIANATGATYVTPPFTTTARYRVDVKAAHCTTTSQIATVSACSYNPVVGGGEIIIDYNTRANLSLPNLSPVKDKAITWYKGAVDIRSNPVATGVGINLSYLTELLTQTTLYWAEFNDSGCVSKTNVYTVRPCNPAITLQPVGKLIAAGTSATLVVGATPIPGQTYQWYAGPVGTTTTLAPNGTGSTLNVSPNATTSYWCRVSTPCGRAADSAAATVEVCHPPQILTAPYTYYIPSGASQMMSMSVADGDAYTYQWYRGVRGDTSNPMSSTQRTFTASPTTTTSYWMRATSLGLCTSDSNTLVIDVCTPPVMSVQPASQAIQSGSPVTLTAAATSPRPLTYQWYRGPSGDASLVIAGATSSSLTVSPTTQTSYWCRITTSVCSVDSAAATISMCAYPPVVKSSPAPQSAYSGEVVTIQMGPLSPVLDKNITWYRGAAGDRSTPVKTGTGVDLTYTVQVTANQQYWAEFTANGCVSRTGTYAINVCRPTITSQPQSSTIVQGAPAALSVAASGSPLTFQWYKGVTGDLSQPIAGATSSAYAPVPATTTSYWVRATGCISVADSATATVTVCAPPAITSLTRDLNFAAGTVGNITVVATGEYLTYQWYKGQSGDVSRPIANATSSVYTFTLQTSEYYWVRVRSTCLNVSVDSAAIMYSVEANVLSYPAAVTIPRNTSTTLTVVAQGTYLTYTWYQGNDVLIPGATSASYTTPPLATATSYRVNVGSGDRAGKNGPYRTVSLCDGPSVYGFTSSVSGSITTFTVNVAINDRPNSRYDWYRGVRGDVAQSTSLGSQGSSFSMAAPAPGTYWVRVRWADNSCYTDTVGKTIP
jgi:hypothetical protein